MTNSASTADANDTETTDSDRTDVRCCYCNCALQFDGSEGRVIIVNRDHERYAHKHCDDAAIGPNHGDRFRN